MRKYETWPGVNKAGELWGLRVIKGQEWKCPNTVRNIEHFNGITKRWECERPRGHAGMCCNYTHDRTVTFWDAEEMAKEWLIDALHGE